MPDAPSACVVGAGKAGRSLAAALEAASVPVLGTWGRDRPLPTVVGVVDVVIVAVPDAAVTGVFEELAAAAHTRAGPGPHAVVLQLSGARAPDASDAVLRGRVAGVGTFHPLVPLADPNSGAERLRGVWIGLGGDAAAVTMGRRLADRIAARTLTIPDAPDARAVYHAAAVFASNFPVVLAATAERLFAAAGVEREGARGAVRGLLASAAANVGAAMDPAAALTGPVARGDAATVARHLAALTADADADALYRALARATVDVARESGAPPRRGLDVIASMLERPEARPRRGSADGSDPA